jgi:hypothetical protein
MGVAFTVWSAEPYGEHPPGIPQQVETIARQVEEIWQVLARLQEEFARTSQELASRLPLHLDIDTVEHLEFHFDSIDINDLGGELNIGLTSMLKTGEKDHSKESGADAHAGRKLGGEQQAGHQESICILWPPQQQEGAK